MSISKIIFTFLFTFFSFSSLQSFTDNGKGAQSNGREDSSYLNIKNGNFKKGIDALKQATKYEKKIRLRKQTIASKMH